MTVQIERALRRYDQFKVCVSVGLAVWVGVWYFSAEFDGKKLGGNAGGQAPVEQASVSVSHPQLLSPAKGSELEYGFVKFEGVAPTGTEVIVFGDGAEMGSAFATQRGKFIFDIKVVPPVPRVYSIAFYSAAGTQIGGEEDLGLTVGGEYETVARPFAVFRPVHRGRVKLGTWIIAGTGKPGSQVKLQIDRFQLGIAEVEDDGTWSFERTVTEPGIKRQLTAREIDGYADEIIAHTISIVE